MELTTSWKEEGRKEGRTHEGQEIVLRQLSRRWKRLALKAERTIRTSSVTKLEELEEALLGFSALADPENWLRENQSRAS